ncbi:unnamed protein product [Cyprideis torosa]|uniref:Uncharacterized protein n=1 Tax=Cyprideis torosa TaxID=163714 RepID=A0A7R8WBK0_9CRUS|nr:unnamed protein product [Cyprideis torosa]CAG0892211.1 unnamed protein product [Cyprideis torosa]
MRAARFSRFRRFVWFKVNHLHGSDILVPKICLVQGKSFARFKHPGSEDLFGSRYMTTCVTCPRQYPWLGDYRGAGGDTTDIYRPEIIPAA